MTRSLYILLMLISFGLFFMQNDLYACTVKEVEKSKTEEMHSCCKKQNSKEVNKKEVDKKCHDKSETSKPVSDKTHHDCDGHCNHNYCSCASLGFTVNLPQTIDLKLDTPNLDSENTIISHNENRLPSGYHSIWLPPVIS